MQFILPVLSAILQSASFTIDKFTLGIKKVTYKNYTVISFPLIFIFTLIIFLIFRPPLSLELFHGKYLWLIILSIVLGICTNIIFYKVMKTESLTEIETITLINRVPVVIFAGIFFIEERNYVTMALAIFSALILIWSHWEKHHFHIAKRTWPFLMWTLIVAPFGAIITKELLQQFNPIALHLVTSGAEALFFVILFSKSFEKTPKQAIPFLFLTNILTTIAWILYFFSFVKSGIVFTVLVFSLQPLLVYISSIIFLKEKFNKKKAFAFLIILVSIAATQIL